MSSTGSNSWVAELVGVDQGLNGHLGKQGPVEGDEAVAHIAVVDEVDLSVVCER